MRSRSKPRRAVTAFVAAMLAGAGCNVILGIDELSTGPADSSTTSSTSSGGGGDASGGATGGGGVGNGGGGAGGGGMGGAACTSFCPIVEWIDTSQLSSGDDVGLAVAGNDDLVVVVGDLGADGEFLETSLEAGRFAAPIQADGFAVDPPGPISIPGKEPRVALGSTTFVAANFDVGDTINGMDMVTSGAYVATVNATGLFGNVAVFAPNDMSSNIRVEAIDADGSTAVVVGTFDGSVSFGALSMSSGGTQPNLFVYRFAPMGTSSVHTFPATGAAASNVRAVAIAKPSGDIVVTGRRGGPVSLPGGMALPSGQGLYVIRLNAAATALTAPSLAFNAGIGRRLAADEADGVALLGFTADDILFDLPGEEDPTLDDTVFATRLSASNLPTFVTSLQGASDAEMDIAIAPLGNVAVTGSYSNALTIGQRTMTSSQMEDIFVAILNGGTGEHLWSDGYGGPFDDHGHGIAFLGDHLVFTGSFAGTAQFGDETLTSTGGTDVFVASVGLPE